MLMTNRIVVLGLLGLLALAPGAPGVGTARAQQEQAVLSAVQYLRGAHGSKGTGETAMIALGLLKAEVPTSDPALAACLEKIRSRFTSGGYSPERTGIDVYEASAVALALSNLPASERGSMLETVGAYLISKQKPNGSWSYPHHSSGDSSISQYAILGLWECENGGVAVPPSVWDRAAQWYLGAQGSSGGWVYHPGEGGAETISMTAAGVGSLLICQRQLRQYRQFQKGVNPYLTPIDSGAASAEYRVVVTEAQLNAAIARGMNWISANFNTSNTKNFGPSVYYGLYGIERIGALADRQMIGRIDWFERGRAYIRSTQKPDGGWSYPPYDQAVTSVWAILFLTKSTAKTLHRVEIQRLGAGTLLGGRYLPSDLSTMAVAGGRIISRPMNGAVEGMLDILEDPRIRNGDSAVAGIVERYNQQGPAALRPHKDRFRRMLEDRDPGVRQVAAWALGRTGDLDVVPSLIDALEDADEQVAASARQGLQLISRKVDDPGPAPGATPEQKQAAAGAWRRWYDLVRPLEASYRDETAETDEAAASNRPGDGGGPP